MHGLLRIGALLIAFLIAAATGLFLLPLLKEGYGPEELGLLAGIGGALTAAALVWWAAFRRSRHVVFLALGLLALGLPLSIYWLLAGRVAWNVVEGGRLSGNARVTRYAETPIVWPGFDGPVGLHMELELEHGVGREGNLYPPKLLMDSGAGLSHRSYFSEASLPPRYLSEPLFQFAELSPKERGPALEASRRVLASGSLARMTYDLYPSFVRGVTGPERVCLSEEPGRNGPTPDGSGELGALWFFAASGGLYVDLSSHLTAAVRRHSAFQGKPREWSEVLGRLAPENLGAAGYSVCEASPSAFSGRCYCRGQSGTRGGSYFTRGPRGRRVT